jgi:hypothetical protein
MSCGAVDITAHSACVSARTYFKSSPYPAFVDEEIVLSSFLIFVALARTLVNTCPLPIGWYKLPPTTTKTRDDWSIAVDNVADPTYVLT